MVGKRPKSVGLREWPRQSWPPPLARSSRCWVSLAGAVDTSRQAGSRKQETNTLNVFNGWCDAHQPSSLFSGPAGAGYCVGSLWLNTHHPLALRVSLGCWMMHLVCADDQQGVIITVPRRGLTPIYMDGFPHQDPSRRQTPWAFRDGDRQLLRSTGLATAPPRDWDRPC
jgi:hypothetical protein